MIHPVKQTHGTRVMVGLSGGVDSAVTAALLQRQGYAVHGVFIKGWYPPGLPCTWAEDRRDAMRVAAALHIPFTTLDASKEYKKSVIDYLIEEYGAGRTPNPDIFCNRDVKFGVFYRYAMRKGMDFIATGHYARAKDGRLYRGADASKDQSYFLWAISRDAVTHTLFPLGDKEKSEVRTLAESFALPVAKKKDSQGICFLGPVSIQDFLKSEIDLTSGTAFDEKGEMLGTHDGALVYALGERVSLQNAPPGPWFVVQKDIEKNEIVVAHAPKAVESPGGILLRSTNFIDEPVSGKKYSAQYRYHGPLIEGVYDAQSKRFVYEGNLPEPMSHGQSLVLYEHDQCIGGGIIGG